MKRILLPFALLVSGLPLAAQDSTKANVLNEVVISTSRTEKEAMTEPRSITVISAQQITASNVKTLPELLAQIESIYIVGNGMNPGNNQSVSMRGTNTNQSAILIDGVSLNDPSSPNNAFDISDLTLNAIERIEVVRGSNSTLYGSGAIGGSINIITKGKGDKPFEGAADVRVGTNFNYLSTAIRYTDKSGIYGSFSMNAIRSKGFDATVDTSTKAPIEPRDLDDFIQTDLIAKLGYDKNKLKVSGMVKSLQKNGSIDKSAFNNDNNYTLQTTRSIYHVKAQYDITPRISVQGFVASSMNKRISTDDSSVVALPNITDHNYFQGTYTGTSLQSEITGVFRNNETNLVLGGGTNGETMNNETNFISNDPMFPYAAKLNYADSGLKQSNRYVFFHLDYNFAKMKAKEFNIALGARMNNHNRYGNAFTFEIAPSYSHNGTTIYLSHSNGFLNPSLYQLYANDPSTSLMGNKNLKPQYSRSYEFGFKKIIDRSVYFTAAIFRIDTRNPVQYVNLWNKNTAIDSLTFFDFMGNTYLNAGTQQNSGIDVSLNLKASAKLQMILRYNYIESKLTANIANLDTVATNGHHVQLFEGGNFLAKEEQDIRVARRPTNTINAILIYMPSANFSFRLDTRYISPRYDVFYNSNLGPFGALDSKLLDGYALMDFFARYSVSNNVTLGFKIDNLLNTKYTEIIGYRTRGTAYFLDLQVKL